MEIRRVDPIRLFEGPHGVMQLYAARAEIAIGNNATILAGVSGERIRIMGMVFSAEDATAGFIRLKSASGGTQLLGRITCPVSTSPAFQLPIVDSGYCETNTGEGLFADVAIAAVYGTIFYITYTP